MKLKPGDWVVRKPSYRHGYFSLEENWKPFKVAWVDESYGEIGLYGVINHNGSNLGLPLAWDLDKFELIDDDIDLEDFL